MLDLCVLLNAFDPNCNPLPITLLALTLDNEVQCQCAGYIQGEIERYAEFLGNDEDDNKPELSDAEIGSDKEGPVKLKVKLKKSCKDHMLEHYQASLIALIFLSNSMMLSFSYFFILY